MPFLETHPEPSDRQSWRLLQLGLWVLPLSPFLGGLGAVAATVWVWRRQWRSLMGDRLNQALAIWLLLLLVSALTAIDRQAALLGLFNFFPFVWVFTAACRLVRSPDRLRQISWISAIASIPVIIVGIGQMYSGWHGPIALGLVVNWSLPAGGMPVDRMASVFGYANTLACYSAIVFLLTLALWIETRWQLSALSPKLLQTRASRNLYRRSRLLLGILIGHAIVLVSTSSRNAWAIVVLGALIYALYLGWRWLVALVTAGAGLVLGAAFAPSPVNLGLRAIVPAYFWARLTDELYSDRPLAQFRRTQWAFASQLTLDRPWTGWGLRSFSPLYEREMQLWLGHPHNLAFMLSAETGLPSTLLLLGIVGWIVVRGIETWRYGFPSAPESPDGDENEAIERRFDRLLFFSYLIAFGAIALFHTLDVPLFDARINLLGWLLLAAIWGNSQKKAREAREEDCSQ
ncbi:MAG TPA: O-antigen ligase family protein [Oscillatoriales cyanobacterium M4454_W2019_049]|nr:O-antigen ligase family protein [Oscillatoriales cyanobacterium M4454_W2019_049]